ncbi:MAG: hypothetical protein KDC10_10605 [Calditrichaeota bacterium]|nr:hypothetical protein [Calditrichota bacterium]MCB9473156.1 hypothetical protein [Candidatus Delongbacteria bacterium]
MISICLLLLMSLVASAQQIVVKHTGQVADVRMRIGATTWIDKDLDGDGVREVFMDRWENGANFFNPITGEMYSTGVVPHGGLNPKDASCDVGQSRSHAQADIATSYGVEESSLRVYDVMTGEVLYETTIAGGIQRILARDFDGDGLDDYFVYYPRSGDSGETPHCYDYIVLGTGAASLESPGATLDIATVGANALLTWQSVSGADGYRVLWAAVPESPCFTQVGYTQESTFTHVGFADVPRGFYKVIAVTAGGHTGGIAGEGSR